MKRLTIAIVAAVIASAGTGLAREAVPFEIAPPRIGPAPGDHMSLKLAASHDQLLAVWTDTRDWYNLRVMGTRVTSGGEALDRPSLVLSHKNDLDSGDGNYYEKFPGITAIACASDGRDFMVLSRVGEIVRSTLVTADGKVVANTENLPSAFRADLIWLGSEYAYIYVPNARFGGGSPPLIRYLILDRNGRQTGLPHDIVTTAGYVSGLAAAVGRASTFMIAWADYSDGRIHDIVVPIDKVRAGTWTTVPAEYGAGPSGVLPEDVALASDGRTFFCVWREKSGPDYRAQYFAQSRLLDENGSPIGPITTLGNISNQIAPTAAFDGTYFIAAFATLNSELITARVRNGVFEPSAVAPLYFTGSQFPTCGVTANGKGAVVFWKYGNLLAAPLPFVAGGSQNPGQVVSLGGALRTSIQSAWCGDHYFSTWIERSDRYTAVYGRLDAEGHPLDGAGVVLGESGLVSMASDGANALVVWSGVDGLNATLVDAFGHATRRKIFDRAAAGEPIVVGWTGTDYITVWVDWDPSVPYSDARTMAARIARDGTLAAGPVSSDRALYDMTAVLPLNSGYSAVVERTTGFCFPMCTSPTTLYISFLSPALKLVGAAETLSVSTDWQYDWAHWASTPAVATRGNEILIAWAGIDERMQTGSRIWAARLDSSGIVIDKPPGINIGPGAHVTGVVATSTGFDIVGGSSAWSVSPDLKRIDQVYSYDFVPADTSRNASNDPEPFALLVPGGRSPMIIYQKSSDDQHDVRYYVGAFAPPARTRAVRP